MCIYIYMYVCMYVSLIMYIIMYLLSMLCTVCMHVLVLSFQPKFTWDLEHAVHRTTFLANAISCTATRNPRHHSRLLQCLATSQNQSFLEGCRWVPGFHETHLFNPFYIYEDRWETKPPLRTCVFPDSKQFLVVLWLPRGSSAHAECGMPA